MKVSAFKKLIMEAAKEGVKQGLQEILQETKLPIQENFSFTSDDVPISKDVRKMLATKMGAIFENNTLQVEEPSQSNGNNGYMSFLQETAQNMTAQDRQGIANLGETY